MSHTAPTLSEIGAALEQVPPDARAVLLAEIERLHADVASARVAGRELREALSLTPSTPLSDAIAEVRRLRAEIERLHLAVR